MSLSTHQQPPNSSSSSWCSYSDPQGSVQHVVLYAEASYFDGYHFAHIAAWLEHIRVHKLDQRINKTI